MNGALEFVILETKEKSFFHDFHYSSDYFNSSFCPNRYVAGRVRRDRGQWRINGGLNDLRTLFLIAWVVLVISIINHNFSISSFCRKPLQRGVAGCDRGWDVGGVWKKRLRLWLKYLTVQAATSSVWSARWYGVRLVQAWFPTLLIGERVFRERNLTGSTPPGFPQPCAASLCITLASLPDKSFSQTRLALGPLTGVPSLFLPNPFNFRDMAGHNKWSKVKHTKGPADAKRSNVFAKLSKEITVASKSGGNPDMNARLRSAILNAKAVNMPSDTIERAIKKGTGELGGAVIEEIVYEGYGPGGVAMLVEVATDNRNRSAQDMRTLFSKNNGAFADAGSVAYLFQRRGEVRLEGPAYTEETATELALEVGADDVVDDGEEWALYTSHDKLFTVAAALKDKNVTPKSQKLIYQPSTTLTIADPTVAKQLVRLYETLDEYDDTQNVYANFELTDEAAEALAQ